MNFSLRGKFFGLGTLCVVLVAVPLIFFAGRDFQRNSHERGHIALANIVRLLEDNLSTLYFAFLASRAEDVVESRKDLYRMARIGRDAWRNLPEEASGQLFQSWDRTLRRTGFSFSLFIDDAVRYGDRNGVSSLAPDRRTFTGELLRDMLRPENLPPSGAYALFILDPEEWRRFGPLADENGVTGPTDGGPTPILVNFLPVPDKHGVITLSMALERLESLVRGSRDEIIKVMQGKFDATSFYANGSLHLFDARGATLAYHGPADALAAHPARELLAKASEHLGRKPSVEVLSTSADGSGAVLYRIARFRSLDWYLAVGVPLDELEAPTRALIRHLAGIALVTIGLGLVITLALTATLTRPLRALTHKAGVLAAADFSLPGVVRRALGESGPGENSARREKDEVRQLAQAFSRLGKTLDEKIAELVNATAAKERMQGELAAAREIQMGMLPAPDAAGVRDGWDVRALLIPAWEVGGDFYDFLTAPDGRQAVVIGDVSGKGVPAALFMAMSVTLLRSALRSGDAPAQAMTRLNACLAENNPGSMFLTLFVGLLNPDTGELDYANGGHCRPLIADQAGRVRVLQEMSGPLVGALPNMDFTPRRTTLLPGETCLLFTDGVSEAMDTSLALYGEKRLATCFAAQCDADCAALLRAIHASVVAHAAGEPQSDDITLLALRFIGHTTDSACCPVV